MAGAGVIGNGDAVLCFAATVIVRAFAVSRAAQVGQIAVVTLGAQGFGGGLDDFVGECAALGRVGVADDGDAAFCALGGQIQCFQIASGTGDGDGGLRVEHGCPF